MALLHVNYYSDVLGLSMNMDVILPQQTDNMIGMKGVGAKGKLKTIYLLHGMSDDHTIWQRRTSIERYVSELGVAVVMPTVHLGYYTDTAYGMKYWTFISEELPRICQEFFPQMSTDPEDNLAAGLSMGGYGAWKLGLLKTERFGYAASLSGSLDMASRLGIGGDSNVVDNKDTFFKTVFGDLDSIKGSKNDLLFMAEKKVKEGNQLPKLYAWCGTEDFLYQNNIHAWKVMKELGYDLTTEESAGDHQWKYWDEKILTVLNWWLTKRAENKKANDIANGMGKDIDSDRNTVIEEK